MTGLGCSSFGQANVTGGQHGQSVSGTGGFAARARYNAESYARDYAESVNDPEGFWKRVAGRIDWFKFPSEIRDVSYNVDDFRIRWYADGELNVSVNCLDRHLATRADKTAILWEGDIPNESEHITYRDLHARVCKARVDFQTERGRTVYVDVCVELAFDTAEIELDSPN